MAGKKDNVVTCVVSGLTSRQAHNLASEIMTAKSRIAPTSRGMASVTTPDGVARQLTSKTRKLLK